MVAHTISAIVPIHDRSTHLLAEALDSIHAQTRRPEEILVVDDGSKEPVAPWVAENYGTTVRTITIAHSGIGGARNAGVAAANGSLLSFLDSDDLWMPHKLERQAALLDDDDRLEAAFGRAEQFHDPDTTAAHRARYPIRERVIDAWLSTAMLIRAESFDRIGPFGDHSAGVDVDWMFTANDLGLQREMLPEIVYRRRIHTSNISIDQAKAHKSQMLSVVRDSLARQRADTPS